MSVPLLLGRVTFPLASLFNTNHHKENRMENQIETINKSTGEVQTIPQVDYSPAERAASEEVRAMVEARCLMALRRPRNIMQSRGKLMEACARTAFAETAMYRKPVGKKDGKQTYAEGPSIRFAEEAYRALGNLWSAVAVQLETTEKRVLRFDLMDLENNTTDSTIITVAKTVERKFVRDGQTVISKRINSYGDMVYLIEANDDELQVKQQAMVAKVRRDAILRATPSDIKEDAIAMIRKTLTLRDQSDPKGALKRLLDAFQFEIGILPEQIVNYLGHGLDIISPDELMALRGVFAAVKDGEATWATVMTAVEEDRAGAMKSAGEKAASRKTAKEGAAKGAPSSAPETPGQAEGSPAGQPSPEPPSTPTEPLTAVQRAVAQAKKTGAQIQNPGDALDIPME